MHKKTTKKKNNTIRRTILYEIVRTVSKSMKHCLLGILSEKQNRRKETKVGTQAMFLQSKHIKNTIASRSELATHCRSKSFKGKNMEWCFHISACWEPLSGNNFYRKSNSMLYCSSNTLVALVNGVHQRN